MLILQHKIDSLSLIPRPRVVYVLRDVVQCFVVLHSHYDSMFNHVMRRHLMVKRVSWKKGPGQTTTAMAPPRELSTPAAPQNKHEIKTNRPYSHATANRTMAIERQALTLLKICKIHKQSKAYFFY